MTDEDYEREVTDLAEMLRNLRLIKDKGRRKWLVKIIREKIVELTKS